MLDLVRNASTMIRAYNVKCDEEAQAPPLIFLSASPTSTTVVYETQLVLTR